LRVKPTSRPSSSGQPSNDLSIVPSFLQLRHILVPIDFSEHSEKSLKYAARFAEQFGSRVTLLHVIQPVVYPADFGYPATVIDTLDDQVRSQVQVRLETLAEQAVRGAKSIVRVGQPYHEITTAAKDLDVDLIIVTTHGHTGLKHALLGSTAERVVRHAPCPVLTLRERERDFV
jgi:nucleotide-binding universal stress UspA family protein